MTEGALEVVGVQEEPMHSAMVAEVIEVEVVTVGEQDVIVGEQLELTVVSSGMVRTQFGVRHLKAAAESD